MRALLWVLCVGLLAGGLALCGWVAHLWYGVLTKPRENPPPAVVKPEPAPGKVWDREAFRALVLNRGKNKVIEAVGRPARTQDVGQDSFWYYENVTRDRVTGKLDATATVLFQGDTAVLITF